MRKMILPRGRIALVYEKEIGRGTVYVMDQGDRLNATAWSPACGCCLQVSVLYVMFPELKDLVEKDRFGFSGVHYEPWFPVMVEGHLGPGLWPQKFFEEIPEDPYPVSKRVY